MRKKCFLLFMLILFLLTGCRNREFTETAGVTLFFADAEKESLASESRMLQLTMTDSLPLKTVQELIRGPEDADHAPLIASDTEVLRIWIRDGICYVDLSRAFTDSRYIGTEKEEKLVIASLVRTLTGLPAIRQVQILIEGEQRLYYQESVRIDAPLSE